MRRLTALTIFAGIACAQIRVTPLFENLPGETSDPVLSPDGKTLAFEWCKPDYTCGIYMRPFAGGEPHLLTGASHDPIKDGSPSHAHWSPDGSRIAFTRTYYHFDNRLVVLDLSTGRDRELVQVCDYARGSNWSPDGRYLAASVSVDDAPCRPALFLADTGARVLFFGPQGGSPALSPDGRRVAYSNGQDLMLVQLDSAYRPVTAPMVLVHELHQISNDACWSADGKEILYAFRRPRAASPSLPAQRRRTPQPAALVSTSLNTFPAAWPLARRSLKTPLSGALIFALLRRN